MSELSPRLGLPYIQAAQAQKHVTHNEALRRLDVMVQATVLNRDLTQPPVAPADGDCHIVASGAGGPWAGQDGALAQWDGAAWLFVPAQTGMQAYVAAEAARVIYTGTDWNSADADPETLGINTSADTTNRLAVAAPSTLLTNDGAGHQLKINKAASADTASLLFQTNWSGRAEMGTTGSDAFAIKVSADGTTWTQALSFDPTSGHASGAAVQASAGDATAGRLMRADWGYGPGSVLGSVSHSGGQPTGRLIEQGSNLNGTYLRLADGTQICTHVFDPGDTRALGSGGYADPYRSADITWLFPAPFATGTTPIFQGAVQTDSNDEARYQTAVSQMVSATQVSGLQVVRLANYAGNSINHPSELHLMAIGRWF